MLKINKEMTETGTAVLQLEGDVTVESSDLLHQALLGGLREHDHLMVDCEEVTSLDFYAIQLLCSAHRTSVAWNKRLTWHSSPSNVIRTAMKAAGVVRHQGCSLCPEDVCCMWT